MARPTTASESVAPGEAPAGPDAPVAFTAAVSAITDAFGDPTRRRIYLFTRDHGGATGVTASAVAAEVGVHPNVARHHLDKLAAGGYVEVVGRGASSERRAGRPSKRYVAVASGAFDDAGVPVRSDDLVLALLGKTLSRLPQHEAAAMAEEVGATYGRAMAAGLTGDDVGAGQRSLRSAMQAVADALTAHGFAAHMDAGDRAGGGLRIINDHCPFGAVATDHPVICAVDRGMVRGMLGALYGGEDVSLATSSSKARGDTICATAV